MFLSAEGLGLIPGWGNGSHMHVVARDSACSTKSQGSQTQGEKMLDKLNNYLLSSEHLNINIFSLLWLYFSR